MEACRLTPGIHYKHFGRYGDKLPEVWGVTAVCKQCLPGGAPRAEEAVSDLRVRAARPRLRAQVSKGIRVAILHDFEVMGLGVWPEKGPRTGRL